MEKKISLIGKNFLYFDNIVKFKQNYSSNIEDNLSNNEFSNHNFHKKHPSNIKENPNSNEFSNHNFHKKHSSNIKNNLNNNEFSKDNYLRIIKESEVIIFYNCSDDNSFLINIIPLNEIKCILKQKLVYKLISSLNTETFDNFITENELKITGKSEKPQYFLEIIANLIINKKYKIWGSTLLKNNFESNLEEIITQRLFSIDETDDKNKIIRKITKLENRLFYEIVGNIENKNNKILNMKYELLPYSKNKELRYGENSHQKSVLYLDETKEYGFGNYEQIWGKELSYNNIIDIDTAFNILEDFKNETAVCVIKHNNPCGLASGKSEIEALKHAWLGDEVSAYGSIIGFTGTVCEKSADFLSKKFVEVIIAKNYNSKALDTLKKKKNLRIIKIKSFSEPKNDLFKSLEGGFIKQTKDNKLYNELKIVSKKQDTSINKELLYFSIKTVKHLKSNAISLNYEYEKGYFCLVGKGIGQPNRVDSYKKIAISEAKRFWSKNLEPQMSLNEFLGKIVLASEAFFPFSDLVEYACSDGIKIFLQPGGSIRDEEVIDSVQKMNGTMFFTGLRHFKH